MEAPQKNRNVRQGEHAKGEERTFHERLRARYNLTVHRVTSEPFRVRVSQQGEELNL